MSIHKISTLANYRKWEQWFRDNDYAPWQYQYGWDSPEGLHAWFAKAGEKDIEIVTHDEEVREAIMKFNK